MIRELVTLHAVEPGAVGLAGWGRPDGFLERQLSRWLHQWEAAHTVERPTLLRVAERLRHALPPSRRTGIVHGDYKYDNVILAADDPGRIVAILDWEMSTLGDPLCDLGLLLCFWDEPGEVPNPHSAGATARPGFPTRAEMAQRYADQSGADIGDLDWYIAFADFKLTVILDGNQARYVAGATVGSGFEQIQPFIEPLLDRAEQRASHLGEAAS